MHTLELWLVLENGNTIGEHTGEDSALEQMNEMLRLRTLNDQLGYTYQLARVVRQSKMITTHVTAYYEEY